MWNVVEAQAGVTSQKVSEIDAKSIAQASLEDRAAYIPFTVAETVRANNELKTSFPVGQSYTSSSSSTATMNPPSPVAIDLHVTNLDQSIGTKEMKNLLISVFKQHVVVSFSPLLHFSEELFLVIESNPFLFRY